MLDILKCGRKAFWVGLIMMVLTPFVFRPVLTLFLHPHADTFSKQTSARASSSHHKTLSGINQTREKDPEAQRSFELFSKAISVSKRSSLWNQPEMVLSHSKPKSYDSHCPVFLRI